jgi:hypothetical protein
MIRMRLPVLMLTAAGGCVLASGCGSHSVQRVAEGATAITSSASSTPSSPTMQTVPSQAFTARDLVLRPPNAAAATSQAQAEEGAKSRYHADRVLETKLAEVVKPGLDRLCWVISLPPQFATAEHPPLVPGGTAPPTVKATYLVVFVNAQSGAPIFSASGTT